MINEYTVRDLAAKLEEQLRYWDSYITTCPKWAKPRAIKQRNALNAACDALERFSRA